MKEVNRAGYIKPVKKVLALLLFSLLICSFCYPQQFRIKGVIKNYGQQWFRIYHCYGDSFFLIDSVLTGSEGEFVFSAKPVPAYPGMYKLALPYNQFFYILHDGTSNGQVEIQTVYIPSVQYNVASDSLVVIRAAHPLGNRNVSQVNKEFYNFQHLRNKLDIADYTLLHIMQLYPLHDPFHKQIEQEYFKRHLDINRFIKRLVSKQQKGAERDLISLVARAYYQPVIPEWKDPDPERNKVFRTHYFDYFNPADSFYIHTCILPEKINLWMELHFNKRGSLEANEKYFEEAADTFLIRVKNNIETFDFVLDYMLKSADKIHFDNALLYLYDTYVRQEAGSCEPSTASLNWAREKVSALRNIRVGSVAPDFDIEKGNFTMHQLQSAYTLLIFWASWCPHCTGKLPEIKATVDEMNRKLAVGDTARKNTGQDREGERKMILTVAVSLDTSELSWQKYVHENDLFTWLNTSELKGWNGEVPKMYNIYATPSMFLLDKDKKIIAKPQNSVQLWNVGELLFKNTQE